MTPLRRIAAFVDWRFLFSLAVLSLVVLVGMSWRATVADNHAKDARIDRLIAQGEREHYAAAKERRQLLAGQRDLNRKYEALLAYLRDTGVYVPPSLLDANPSNDSNAAGERQTHDTVTHRRTVVSRGNQGSGGGSPSTGGGGGSDNGGSKSGSHTAGKGSGHSGGKGAGHSKGGHAKSAKGSGHSKHG